MSLAVTRPNNAGQSNMDAQSGCNLWTQNFEQLRTVVPGIQLGSAAPDNSPSGKQWLLVSWFAPSKSKVDEMRRVDADFRALVVSQDFDSLCPDNKPDL